MKNWGGLIGILVLAAMVLGAIYYKKTDSYDSFAQHAEHETYDFNTKIKIIKYNMKTFTQPPRAMDGALKLKMEQDLKMFIPPFKEFRHSQWKRFWEYIMKPKDNKDIFAMRRWRTKNEMESFFKRKFPDPFSRFSPKHWEQFWGVLEESSKFKHVVYDDTMTESDQVLIDQGKAKFLRTPKGSRFRYDLSK